MSGRVEGANFLIFLGGACTVVHVAQVVFAEVIVGVVSDKLVFRGELEDDCEDTEKGEDYFFVNFLLRSDDGSVQSMRDDILG